VARGLGLGREVAGEEDPAAAPRPELCRHGDDEDPEEGRQDRPEEVDHGRLPECR
jgi:hypothetical protein